MWLAGLIVCILLLGYGLVEIPRVLWRRSFPEKRLRWHYHRHVLRQLARVLYGPALPCMHVGQLGFNALPF